MTGLGRSSGDWQFTSNLLHGFFAANLDIRSRLVLRGSTDCAPQVSCCTLSLQKHLTVLHHHHDH